MDIDNIVGLILIFFVVVIPVLGLTARFAFKPVVESLLQLRGAILHQEPRSREEARLLELEEEVRELRGSMDRLTSSREWERALLEGGDPVSPPQARTPGPHPGPTGEERETGKGDKPGLGP